MPLPPGQRAIAEFPRFGLLPFASRLPTQTAIARVQIRGNVVTPLDLVIDETGLTRVEQTSDFHCVTTWSYCGVRWSGFRFSEFYERVARDQAGAAPDAQFVVFRAQDGGKVSMQLEDLLAADVMLADRCNGEPLGLDHGAPIRLVAPQHYGYKSAKHLARIDFLKSAVGFRTPGPQFLVHPRGRVALEERGQWFPGWLLRYAYRPFIQPTIARFKAAMKAHAAKSPSG
jgi:DMSO/TMAO reductase YedYZ molybdopterin-dependent catalytic subunit